MSGINDKETSIKAIDTTSVHRITSGQVVVDLQTAVKELVENALDAGATNVEVRFKEQGLVTIEVVDNGSGIAPADYDSVALKHHTSKLVSFNELTTLLTFGFRGEALSSLCAVCEKVGIVTATATSAPVGTVLELARSGRVTSASGRAARQRGTTITLHTLFSPLPVRRKELERHIKREFGRVLSLLQAYALVPCSIPGRPVRLSVANTDAKGKKTVHIKTTGSPGTRSAVSALWGPKSLDPLVDLELKFDVAPDKGAVKRLRAARTEDNGDDDDDSIQVEVKGLISKFALGCGRTGTDRQFFFVNGRPCTLPKVQKVFNDVYRAFNINQTPFVVADFLIPTASVDINVSPDKRTLFLHAEQNLLDALKAALENRFAPSRSTFNVNGTQPAATSLTQMMLPFTQDLPSSQTLSSSPASTQITDARPTAAPDVPTSTPRATATHHVSVQEPEQEEEEHDLVTSPPTSSHLSALTLNADEPGLSLGSAPLLAEASFTSSIAFDDGSSAPRTSATTGTSSSASRETDSIVIVRSFGRSTVRRPNGPPPPVFELRPRRFPSPVAKAADQGLPSQPLFAPDSDEEAEGQPKESSPEVIMNTQGASWARQRSLSPDTEERVAARHLRHPSITSEKMDDEELAPATPASSKRPSSPKKERTVKRIKLEVESRKGLRSMLASFAAPGSQVAAREESPDEDAPGTECDDEDMRDELDSTPLEPSSSSHEGASGSSSKMAEHVMDDASSPDQDQPPTPRMAVDTPDLLDTPDIWQPEVELPRTVDSGITLPADLDRMRRRWQSLGEPSDLTSSDSANASTQAASLASSSSDADAALSRLITKDDFGRMEVLGQFNLGFILTRLGEDLWIVDQHAADEKYNFENLQRSTRIQSQRLVQPRLLELSAADELVAREHVGVLRQNGFEIDVGEDRGDEDGEGEDVARRCGLRLVAQPISKNTVFDMHDLEEIIQLLHDRPSAGVADEGSSVVRCKKARAMFASRACRKSVMIGMPLKRAQMTTVVRHMGGMDQPWNCPHGRPTMRHLYDLRGSSKPRTRTVDWDGFALEQ